MAHEHTHHITPLWHYLAIGFTLIVMTGVTVGAAQIDFSGMSGISSLNFIIAMLIASFKATLVALFFMHLWYDDKFYLLTFISGLLCLLIFIVVTMFDTGRRGLMNVDEQKPIQEHIHIEAPEGHAPTQHKHH